MDDLVLAVIGGGAGLGRATAVLAATRGAAAVAVLDMDMAAADDTVRMVEGHGIPAAAITCDVRRADTTTPALDEVARTFGRLDTLVNCAAVYPRRPLLEISDDDWDLSLAVNVKGTHHPMAAAARLLRRSEPVDGIRGRIVNVSSVDAFKAHPQNAHYAATKAAVVSLTRSFAAALAPDGILVNAIAPAGMATDRAAAAGFLPELAAANPLGRAATPEEIAEWVLMTGGPRNTYMTGETVIVSGGYVYG